MKAEDLLTCAWFVAMGAALIYNSDVIIRHLAEHIGQTAAPAKEPMGTDFDNNCICDCPENDDQHVIKDHVAWTIKRATQTAAPAADAKAHREEVEKLTHYYDESNWYGGRYFTRRDQEEVLSWRRVLEKVTEERDALKRDLVAAEERAAEYKRRYEAAGRYGDNMADRFDAVVVERDALTQRFAREVDVCNTLKLEHHQYVVCAEAREAELQRERDTLHAALEALENQVEDLSGWRGRK